jgi:hypothetical protein
MLGEAYLPGYGSPDFVASSSSLAWDDGGPVTVEDRQVLLDAFRRASSR